MTREPTIDPTDEGDKRMTVRPLNIDNLPTDLFEVMGVASVTPRGNVLVELIGFEDPGRLTLRFVTALQARKFAEQLFEAAGRALQS